jgi:phosphatidylglycerol:prolipoprotein diacylglycerol transferase
MPCPSLATDVRPAKTSSEAPDALKSAGFAFVAAAFRRANLFFLLSERTEIRYGFASDAKCSPCLLTCAPHPRPFASFQDIAYDSPDRRALGCRGRHNRTSANGLGERMRIHFPSYLHIGPLLLHPHLVFEDLAYVAGIALFLWLRSRIEDPISDSSRWSVTAAAIVGAAVGSKILFWFEDPRLAIVHWHDPLYLLSGKTLVGALIGGLLAVEAMKSLIGERHSTGDLLAPPLALGIAIGRVGCFLTGLTDNTYGIATSLPWGIDFGDGISRHPTQLYESIFSLCLFAFLLRMLVRPHRAGDVFRVFMVSYFTWRLAVDFLKPEVRFAGLSSIQWACVAMLVYYAPYIPHWVVAGVASPVDPVEEIRSGGATRT